MSSKRLIKQNGEVNGTVKYLGKAGDKWLGVPSCIGSQIKGPCSRIDLMKKHAGIDVQAMYPAGAAPKADGWTTDTFLKAAEACHKGGVPFGIGLGETSDSVDTVGAFFLAFGAEVVDAKGNVVVKNDNVRQVLEYYKKLMAFLPSDAPAWDDGSNNRWLVSGKGALIMNPPSAWAVAKRDAPQIAEQCWTHGFPVGPKGRFAPFLPYFWTAWNFSKNKSGCKEPADRICHSRQRSRSWSRPAAATTCRRSRSSPPSRPGPRKLRRKARSTTTRIRTSIRRLSISASPAPPKIAQQIYTQATLTKMCVRFYQGEAMEKTLAWAEGELEGFMRS